MNKEGFKFQQQKLNVEWKDAALIAECKYLILVHGDGATKSVQVTGFVSRAGYLGVTTLYPDVVNGDDDFVLVHLASGLRLHGFSSLNQALGCMIQLESMSGFREFFTETDFNVLAKGFKREKSIAGAVITESPLPTLYSTSPQ
jgi:hypothetical protein